jgi:hypothetical protein
MPRALPIATKRQRRRKSAYCQRLRNYHCTTSRLPGVRSARGQHLLQGKAKSMANDAGCAWTAKRNPCKTKRHRRQVG